RTQIELEKANAAGLVSTNSIRGGANRKVLERICAEMTIFNAWSDENWINAGAAVRVSLICFGKSKTSPILNNEEVAVIYADLTSGAIEATSDLTGAKMLSENTGTCFRGSAKVGKFEITGDIARKWLLLLNSNLKSNADVLKPWANGINITRRSLDQWIIDFGVSMNETEAAFFECPYEHLFINVKPLRDKGRREIRKKYWWRLGETIPAIRKAFIPISRYIATPMVAKYRLFVWLDKRVFPDQQLIVVARADDTTFGILHSRFHKLWSLRMGSSLEDRPRYTPTTTFETFPFPIGLTPANTGGAIETLDSGAIIPTVAAEYRDHAIAIAEAAFQ
ncbi:type IIL restriction-modification enzyme MmeI, partial [Chromatium okenii]|uniref:type IIL restriction-modification enzyme MmeI n=1 Tax=Chromatium okenii TaxID=61644 RepID=UPI0034E98535|nr:class I SAM-dependent DNA methyltransferase [Chromatium okenii]